jgi:hypothetical protein
MPRQEAQAATTACELLEWLAYIDEVEWNQPTAEHYYLAQIAFEIHQIGRMLGGGKGKTIQDFILPFAEQGKVAKQAKTNEATAGRKPIEVGVTPLTDPKWQIVNEQAKAVWMGRLGLDSRGQRTNPNGEHETDIPIGRQQ